MFTLVVTNRKGGTAKTTTSVNLAAEFAQQGNRCLLIDLDPQGHAGIGLGFKPLQDQDSSQSILLNGNQKLNSLLHRTQVDNLFLITSGKHRDTPSPDPQRLHRFLERKQLEQHFDIVVVDTPPNAGIEQEAALLAADGLIIPFQPSPLGREGVDQLLQDLAGMRPDFRKDPGYGLIPIMLDCRVKLDNRILADMYREHGQSRMLRGIRRNVRLAEAFESGEPVNRFDARCRGAFDYHMLAGDVVGLWPQIRPDQQPLSFRRRASVTAIPLADDTRPSEESESRHNKHRGIRLKTQCRQWDW